MGWFFNNNDDDKQSQNPNHHQQSNNSNRNSFMYESKKTKCQNDPKNDEYLICKTVIKDGNGTREQEQRIRKSGIYKNEGFSGLGQLGNHAEQNHKFQRLKEIFSRHNGNSYQNQDYNDRDQLTRNGENNIETQSFVKSYSQSKSCYPDPNDKQYLICKSKIYDGNQTKQVQERVKLSDQFIIPSFRGELSNVGNEIDNQIHQMMRQINSGFNSMMPFLGPMIGLFNAFNPQGLTGNYYRQDQSHNNHNSNKAKYNQSEKTKYFTSKTGKKDTNIYDL